MQIRKFTPNGMKKMHCDIVTQHRDLYISEVGKRTSQLRQMMSLDWAKQMLNHRENVQNSAYVKGSSWRQSGRRF